MRWWGLRWVQDQISFGERDDTGEIDWGESDRGERV